MQIINKIRVNLFKSSQMAFNLAKADSQYRPIAQKIISAKNTNAHLKLLKEVDSPHQFEETMSKINNFEKMLTNISLMEETEKYTAFEANNLVTLALKRDQTTPALKRDLTFAEVINPTIAGVNEKLI
ncbi:hypothetical protein [Kalamiella sp. sgz302252]|uniref:hypothetical protein n=1 Tax=Pantoea sp. sgz302252 TaxID=3341827 RepID=UPI0036D29F38